MTTYIILDQWTDHSMRRVKDSPSRLERAKTALTEMGGQFNV
jgi:uncharacterized protein with GYD domain